MPLEKVLVVFRQVLESLFIERMDMNGEIVARFISEAELQKVVAHEIGEEVYERLARTMTAVTPSRNEA